MNIKKILLGIVILIVLINTAFAAVKTFTIQETDLVELQPTAIDVDNDNVHFYYTPPLNDNGEWQTGLDDAGVYNVNITATDGINQTVEQIVLIVQNKNQPPIINKKKIVVKESEIVNLKNLISDPEEDALHYIFLAPFNKAGIWETNYEDSGIYVTTITVSDAEFITKERVEIEVLNKNSAPQIDYFFPATKIINVNENENLNFQVEVSDDSSKLNYSWKLNGKNIADESGGMVYFDFESSGTHELKVTVSDGDLSVEKVWEVIVSQVNRKPTFKLLPINAHEGEKIIIEVPKTDIDGDLLTYSFEQPFNELGEWKTGFDDAGKHKIEVVATDGKFIHKENVEIVILDVDRAPLLQLPDSLAVAEGEKLDYKINSIDPDGDKVVVKVNDLPPGAIFKNNRLTWKTNFDTILRKGGFYSNVLNAMRLEKHFLQKKEFPIFIESCGKDKCSSITIPIIVKNVNRKPVFDNIHNVEFSETEEVILDFSATDPDGDIVRVRYSDPVSGGKWKTTFDDAGEHIVYISATDGQEVVTVPVKVLIKGKNRMPSLNIKNDKLTVNEGQEFTIHVDATDPDLDELDVTLDYLPPGAEFKEGRFVWNPPHDTVRNKTLVGSFLNKFPYFNKKFNDDSKKLWVEFTASDGEFSVKHPVQITVKNINTEPSLIDYLPTEDVNVDVNFPVIFHVAVEDMDSDLLEYRWDFGISDDFIAGDTVERTFVVPGKKKVKVVVSDGILKVEKSWNVLVSGVEYVEPFETVTFEPATYRVWTVDQ
jgi:PKD repeat protein